MKAVVVHKDAAPIEKAWANQYAGLDAAVKAQFVTGPADWAVRVTRVFTIPALTWTDIIKTVKDAAQAAGAGGVVILASGHGGSAGPDDGIINWDATEPPGGTHVRSYTDPHTGLPTPDKVGKALFWDGTVARYTDPIPHGLPPTLKEEDEAKIKAKISGFQALQKRHDAFDALQQIGNALQTSGVRRLTFTVCNAGASQNFMTRLAKHCHAQVACFKVLTLAFDDGTIKNSHGTFKYNPGKARLILDSDQATDIQGTNRPQARVVSPDLDDSRIAVVANPP
jgi:hypothetical protein